MKKTLDYRTALHDELVRRKGRNEAYSVRAFSRDLKIPVATLNKVLNFERHLPRHYLDTLQSLGIPLDSHPAVSKLCDLEEKIPETLHDILKAADRLTRETIYNSANHALGESCVREEILKHSGNLYTSLKKMLPTSSLVREGHANWQSEQGYLLTLKGRPEDALPLLDQSIATLTRAHECDSQNRRLAGALTRAYLHRGYACCDMGDPQREVSSIQSSIAVTLKTRNAQGIVASGAEDLATLYAYLAQTFLKAGFHKKALKALDSGCAEAESSLATDENAFYARNSAMLALRQAHVYAAEKRWYEVFSSLDRGYEHCLAFKNQFPVSKRPKRLLLQTFRLQARAFEKVGALEKSWAICSNGLSLAKDLLSSDSADSYLAMDCARLMAQAAQTRLGVGDTGQAAGLRSMALDSVARFEALPVVREFQARLT